MLYLNKIVFYKNWINANAIKTSILLWTDTSYIITLLRNYTQGPGTSGPTTYSHPSEFQTLGPRDPGALSFYKIKPKHDGEFKIQLSTKSRPSSSI